MGAIGEHPNVTLQALRDFGTRIGTSITDAVNNAILNDFSFVLSEQTIDLGPLGEQTIGGDMVAFDIADDPLGSGAAAASAGSATAAASLPRGRVASDQSGGRGREQSLTSETELSGRQEMTDSGELVVVIDDQWRRR